MRSAPNGVDGRRQKVYTVAMNRKAIFLAKRLDRIAPRGDRTRIAAGGITALLVAIASGAVLLLLLLGKATTTCVAFLIVGAPLQLVSLLLLSKETIRNRYYSAVWFLFLSVLTAAMYVTVAVLFAIR